MTSAIDIEQCKSTSDAIANKPVIDNYGLLFWAFG